MYVYTNEDFGSSGVHGDHFNHDSQDSFSVHHDSPKMIDITYGVTKISIPPTPHPPPPAHLDLETGSFVAFEQEV